MVITCFGRKDATSGICKTVTFQWARPGYFFCVFLQSRNMTGQVLSQKCDDHIQQAVPDDNHLGDFEF